MVQYDGIYNGGYGIHNDNSSTNKNVWKDLSGNSNDAVLNNFNYNDTSGWAENGLIFDGTDDWCGISKLNYNYMTLEVVYSIPVLFSNTYYTVAANFENGGLGVQLYNNKVRTTIYVAGAYREHLGQTIVLNKKYKTTIVFNGSIIKTFDNNNIISTQINGTIGVPLSNTIFALGANPEGITTSSPYLNGKIYAVRIYNRALSDQEISQNYGADILRYGLNN